MNNNPAYDNPKAAPARDENAPKPYSNELTSDDYYDFDDAPWADPEIRLAYEAALGAFIVAFNKLDDFVTRIVGYGYEVIKRPRPQNIGRNYAANVDLLDTFGGMDVLQLSKAPIAELREIGKMRNFLAHGHFDQNPFDGSYVVAQRKREPEFVKAETIVAWTNRTLKARDALTFAEAIYEFGYVAPL